MKRDRETRVTYYWSVETEEAFSREFLPPEVAMSNYLRFPMQSSRQATPSVHCSGLLLRLCFFFLLLFASCSKELPYICLVSPLYSGLNEIQSPPFYAFMYMPVLTLSSSRLSWRFCILNGSCIVSPNFLVLFVTLVNFNI